MLLDSNKSSESYHPGNIFLVSHYVMIILPVMMPFNLKFILSDIYKVMLVPLVWHLTDVPLRNAFHCK